MSRTLKVASTNASCSFGVAVPMACVSARPPTRGVTGTMTMMIVMMAFFVRVSCPLGSCQKKINLKKQKSEWQ